METQLDTLISAATTAPRPTVLLLHPPRPDVREATRLGVFPAAFAPPTFAHVALIQRAQRQADLTAVLLILNLRNADKGDMQASLRHSAAMLEPLCRRVPWVGLGLSSHPYFPDMLEALHELGVQGEVSFLMGFDTLLRVLDPQGRYLPHYATPRASRDEALAALFRPSACQVAGREQRGAGDLRELLAAQGATAWQDRVRYLPMPRGLHSVSSSLVRERLHRRARIEDLVPRSVAAYIAMHHLYGEEVARSSHAAAKSRPSPPEGS